MPLVVRNNVSYNNSASWNANRTPQNLVIDHNSWDIPLTLTDADFVGPMDRLSLVTAMLAPRKADGSLPDLPNLWPSESSQLRDAGTDVGLPYTGAAPDLGPFQFDPGKPAAILLFR